MWLSVAGRAFNLAQYTYVLVPCAVPQDMCLSEGVAQSQENQKQVPSEVTSYSCVWAPEGSGMLRTFPTDHRTLHRGVSQEKDGQISSAIVSSVQSKITQVRWLAGLQPLGARCSPSGWGTGLSHW